MTINEFDDQALEEAVLIKEATGATVTAVGLQRGGDRAGAARRVCARRRPVGRRRRGRDRPVRLADRGARARGGVPRSWLPTSCSIGVQTPYDVFGQTAPCLAATLGWPQASVVVGVTLADGTARVVQEYAGGQLAVLGLQLPAVVGVQSASSPPRYVAMARLRQAMTEASDRDARRQRRGAGRGARAHLAGPAGAAGAARRCSRAMPKRWPRRSLEVLRERGVLVS